MSGLGGLGEFGFIRHIRGMVHKSPNVHRGIGDDCAVLDVGGAVLLISCDASLEDVHFRRGWPAHAIGYKAAASALSDIAAMGGHAQWLLLTVAVPPVLDVAFLKELVEGVQDAAGSAGAVIVGGDTTRSRAGLMIDITVLGQPHHGRILLRQGARAGDILAVTGYPGVSAAGLDALERGQKAGTLIDRYLYPVPRLEEGRWLAEQGAVRALIDVSDGVAQDAGHIGEESRVGISIASDRLLVDENLKRYAQSVSLDARDWCLAGGEDYELLAAIDPDGFDALRQHFQDRFHLPITAIGVCTDKAGELLVDGAPRERAGFDHFRGLNGGEEDQDDQASSWNQA